MESEKTDYLNLNDVRNLVNITNSYSSNRLSQTSVDFDEKNPGYSLNDPLNKVGDSNKYQYRLLIFFTLQMFILSSLMLSGPFLLGTPKFICSNGSTCTEDNGGCVDKILAPASTHSVVKEFELYCELKYLRSLTESIFFAGSIVGTVFFTFFQMRRKRYLILSWFITFTGLIGTCLSPNIECFLVFWGATGFGAYACYIMSNTLMKEETYTKFYQKASVILFISWGVSQMTFACLYEFLQYWRYLILILMICPSFFLLWGIYFIKESPRYLISYEGNYEEAIVLFNEIALVNNKTELDSEEKYKIKRIHRRESRKKKSFNYYHLFYFKSLRKITLTTFIVNMVFNVSYYGIQFSFSRLGLDLFDNALYVGIAEVASYTLGFFLIPRTKRRQTILVGYMLTSLIGLLYFMNLDKATETIFMFATRMIMAYIHCVVVIYFPEVFPTDIRLVGVGFVNLMGRLGNIYAPWLAEYGSNWLGSPMICIGIINVIGSISAYFMKETFNVQTLDEIEEEKQVKSPLLTES